MMAFTLGFHVILVPFGVALTAMMLIANWRGLRRDDQQASCWRDGGRRWPACCSPSAPCPARC
jgi:cytochrome bd-type quinol oxidase subunit 1